MAGKSGIARQLERVRAKIVQELDINKLLPRLLRRGIFSVSEEKDILSPTIPQKRTEKLLDILSSKDRSAFSDFCKTLEEVAPHLLTSLILENKEVACDDNPPTQALQLGFELALKERDAVLREKAKAQEERDTALRQLESIRGERDQALASLENLTTKHGKLKDGMSSLDRISRTDSRKMKDKPLVVETEQAYEELRFLSSPLNNQNGPNVAWETHQVTLHKAPTFGFGIAVSGGRDSPHFANGDPSVAISDVLKAGPAEGKLQINDRIVTVNGISLENVDHATAINVLRDCGNSVNLVVRRRILLPIPQQERLTPPFKITLNKRNKKDEFGIVLGYKLYVKEIIPHSLAAHEHTLKEGDTVLKINNTPVENLSLSDAKKLVEKSKDKLQLIVSKDRRAEDRGPQVLGAGLPPGAVGNETDLIPARLRDKDDVNIYRPSVRSEEDVYVKDPTSSHRHAVPPGAYPNSENTRYDGHYVLDNDLPVRVALPRALENNLPSQDDRYINERPDGYYSDRDDGWRSREEFPPHQRPGDYIDEVFQNQSIHERYVDMRSDICLDPRQVTFLKDKQTGLGLRLAGGNATGIFIASVQPGSAGEMQGLVEGDNIILANDKEITGLTREEAVSYLTSLVGEVTMVVQYRKEEYDRIMASHEAGDSFHIRVHFNYTPADPATEHVFKIGDIFHVKDTLFRGVGGSWLAIKISEDPSENKKGTIPNSKTADILKTQQNEENNNKENFPNRGRGSLFKRKTSSRRSKSLGKDHWDEVIFANLNTKFPAYERVVFREPGFIRPVVIFGAIADIAREKLLAEYPDKFDSPQVEKSTVGVEKKEKSAIIRLGSIREAITHRKHCLLDVTPQNVDRLNYAQFNPIVVFMKADSKQAVKDIRGRWKSQSKNPRKLLEQSEKIEKTCPHLFTSVLKHMGTDAWFPKLCEMIEAQQRQQIWMSEKQPVDDMSDDFMFPMSTRLSMAAGADSDFEAPRPRDDFDVSPMRKKTLMRSSSDPSVNTHENIPGIPPYPSPPTYKNQKLPPDSKYSNSESSPRSPARDDFQMHPEDRYYPSYYSDHINSPSRYMDSRAHIDPYATLTPSERLRHRVYTEQPYPGGYNEFGLTRENYEGRDNFQGSRPGVPVVNNSPQHHHQPGPAGDNRAYNDNSSHSSDSYSKYVSSPQNKHDDTKLREKFGNLQITGREKSPGHDPYRFTRSTAHPVTGNVDKAKLSDLSARYRKQDGQSKPSSNKTATLPATLQPIKKKEPPPVPAKTISLKQRGIEPDELKMRNYENSNRAYNYADINTASGRHGPHQGSGTPPLPPPPSTSYPGGLDTDRPYEYMSSRQAQSSVHSLNNLASSNTRLDHTPPHQSSPQHSTNSLHHQNIPGSYNNNALPSSYQNNLDFAQQQRQQFNQGGRGYSLDSAIPPPLPPHPSDQDYYDSKAFANEVYMEHKELQRARQVRIQPGHGQYPSIPEQGMRDGVRDMYPGNMPASIDGGYARPRTDDEQLQDMQSSRFRAKSETRLPEISGMHPRYNSSTSNLQTSRVDEEVGRGKTRGNLTNGAGTTGSILTNGYLGGGGVNGYSHSRGRNSSRYKSWDAAKHEHDMFTAYSKLITSQGFHPQRRNFSMSSGELRENVGPTSLRKSGTSNPVPESAFSSYKRPQKQSSFSGVTDSSAAKLSSWRTGRPVERTRSSNAPASTSVPRSQTYGSVLKSRSGDDTFMNGDTESLDEKHTIIATAKGIFTSKGGLLESKETGVSILIPEGAIEENKDQEIYFKVCRDNSLLPPLETEKGETLLSPLVMCGPHGIQFKKPVELRLPHLIRCLYPRYPLLCHQYFYFPCFYPRYIILFPKNVIYSMQLFPFMFFNCQ
ncbi:tight junction protein ZO-1-like isoform X2 [Physella acuta]|uniref:tight junction protein ZO-1-like isoform X2 n=1 Tax=Physella acuta TaxID=109671 RepID=UPI0027DE541B|nr:tight junction protein ZO-1-like isoform X2 [Physella acuta]